MLRFVLLLGRITGTQLIQEPEPFLAKGHGNVFVSLATARNMHGRRMFLIDAACQLPKFFYREVSDPFGNLSYYYCLFPLRFYHQGGSARAVLNASWKLGSQAHWQQA